MRGPPNVDRVFTLTGSSDAVEIADLDPGELPGQALCDSLQRIALHECERPVASSSRDGPERARDVSAGRAGVGLGVPPAALGVGGWRAWGGSLHVTTVVFVSLAMVAAVLIAAAIVDERNARGCGARQAWLSATVLSVGSVVSRGLAKSGRRDRTEDR